MAYISYNKWWESEFDGIVSKRDKFTSFTYQPIKTRSTWYLKTDEKLRTKFEPTDTWDVVNKAYLDEELRKIDGHISYIENDYNEFKLQYNKQSVENILIQRAVKTTVQILYDKGFFDNYANADKILEDFFLTTKHRGDLVEVNEDVQWFYSKTQFKK